MKEPVRWEVGERIFAEARAVSGLFVFVYAAVIGWKWVVREVSGLLRGRLPNEPDRRQR